MVSSVIFRNTVILVILKNIIHLIQVIFRNMVTDTGTLVILRNTVSLLSLFWGTRLKLINLAIFCVVIIASISKRYLHSHSSCVFFLPENFVLMYFVIRPLRAKNKYKFEINCILCRFYVGKQYPRGKRLYFIYFDFLWQVIGISWQVIGLSGNTIISDHVANICVYVKWCSTETCHCS